MIFKFDVDFDEISDGDVVVRMNNYNASVAKKQKLEGINELVTDDLLIEILFRLTSKEVMQCKSVCTRWNTLISTSSCLVRRLISRQLKLNKNHGQVIFDEMGRHLPITLHPTPLSCLQGDKPPSNVLSSCNDLLLCCNDHFTDEPVFYVCNPFTGQRVAIPPAPRCSLKSLPVGFLCDPFYRVDDEGCVTLNSNLRFRIFRLYRTTRYGHKKRRTIRYEDMDFDIDIFSSETGHWSKVKASRQRIYRPTTVSCFSIRAVAVHNGRFCYLVGHNLVVYDPWTCSVCGDVDLPEVSDSDMDPLEGLSCSRGSLWICQLRNTRKILRVWRLKEEQESAGTSAVQYWTLDREIDLSLWSGLSDDSLNFGRVIALHPDDSDTLLVAIFCKGMKVSWNLRTGAREVISTCERYNYSWAKSIFLEVPVWPTPLCSFQ